MLSRLAKIHLLVSILCITAISVLSRYSWDLSLYSLGSQTSSQVKCACDKCTTEGDDDLWFRDHMNASPKPFLSRNHTTSEEDFNWWKHVQHEQRNFTFYNSTLDNLFQMFPYNPDVEYSPDRCRTCAVVGNSGNLKKSHYGPLIDFHDFVIRINRGRTKGFEADVGNKTTHRVMYPESSTQLDNSTHLVLFAFKINDLLWLLRKFNPGDKRVAKSKTIANKDLVMILNPAFMKHVHEKWLGKKGRYPSTGFMTLLFSLHICDEVSVFGFGADSEGNWSHYFEILRHKKLRTGPHAGMVEYKMIEELHDKGKIHFFKGY